MSERERFDEWCRVGNWKATESMWAAWEAASKLRPEATASSDEAKAILRDAARYRWLRDAKPNSLSLTLNEGHAPNYRTAKEWIEEDMPEWFSDEPPEALQAMKDTNTIWALQSYPHTPIGFLHASRATLDELIDLAMTDGSFLPQRDEASK